MKRKSDHLGDEIATKLNRTDAFDGFGTIVHIQDCYIRIQDPWSNATEAIKQAARQALAEHGAHVLILKADWLQETGKIQALRSQKSSIHGLGMFVTADGSTWVDHFYDEMAGKVLHSLGVRDAINRSLVAETISGLTARSSHSLAQHQDRTHVWTEGARARSIMDLHERDVTKAMNPLWENTYAIIILPTGVAKVSTIADPTVHRPMFKIHGDLLPQDVVVVSMWKLRLAMDGKAPATIAAAVRSAAAETTDWSLDLVEQHMCEHEAGPAQQSGHLNLTNMVYIDSLIEGTGQTSSLLLHMK